MRKLRARHPPLASGDLLATGLDDLRQGVESVPALLTQIGAPRRRQLVVDVPIRDPDTALPEHRLYELLARQHGNNAPIRKLVSFTRALACVRAA